VLLALLHQLWSSNGALSVLAPICGLCGAISFLIGWSEFEYHYKTPPGLASRIGELNGKFRRDQALLSPRSAPRLSFKGLPSGGSQLKWSKIGSLPHFIKMKPTQCGMSLKTRNRRARRSSVANSGYAAQSGGSAVGRVVGSGAGTAAPRPETRGFDEATRALASARGVTRCQRPARSNFHIIWNKARRQVGVAHLHLHDLRHTAIR